MKLMVSGGGTGGHVYPALAAVQSLTQSCANRGEPLDILWVGSVGGMEQGLVEQAGLKIELIPAEGLRGKNPLAALKSLQAMRRGRAAARRLIGQYRPDVLFVTGGYVCVPVTLAAGKAGVPVLIYLPDIEPGLAIKFLARYARRVAVTAEQSCRFFAPGQAVVTGYPVRPELTAGAANPAARAEARRRLKLADDLPLLLVFGGSRGARSINQAVTGALEPLLAQCQLLHITGTLDADWVQARRGQLPPDLQARYHVAAYLHREMTLALLAANLVIARAGASVMGEFPAVGLPAILVPYPYAGAHQALNAAYLADHGAAVIIDDADLTGTLPDTALDLLANKPRLRAMQAASAALARPDAAAQLAQQILEVQTYAN
ncbi:MAG: UDP-N-acetylglucosamine--N-acetylmuramyl-(pentapeptide) pyrophosphoryl-undecaprenol N-acetylglucosamine transferase [Anaerolineae bacterium]